MKSATRYPWATWGDVNAFFGLMLDNVAVLVILVSTITTSRPYAFSPEFVLTHMVPGTVIGVLLGDLVYSWMAFRLARRTGRSDVTAMPLGLDTPSTFGVAYLVLIPTLQHARADLGMGQQEAMEFAWQVGAVVLVLSGIFKVICAPLGSAVRRWIPRAGLLGSLAAIALVLITFLPLRDIGAVPVVGMLSLTIILVTLVAHRALPGKIPGALAAVAVGVVLYHGLDALGRWQGWFLVTPRPEVPPVAWQLPNLLPELDWGAVLPEALRQLPIALPFALATVVGGIDCTESAAAAGDEYDTRTILLTEGLATVAAGLCGGVIQNTPYIGHPAYKAMGGRAAYTMATALFVGAMGFFGWFNHFFEWLPRAAMYPILVFVGLEITAQSFRATSTRHYAALALAVLPALAYLVTVPLKEVLPPDAEAFWHAEVLTVRCLSSSFIITSLLWAAALAALLDGGYRSAAVYLLVAGVFALFGVIHSPLPQSPIDWPWNVVDQLEKLPLRARETAMFQTPYHWAASYGLAALLLFGLAWASRERERPEVGRAGSVSDRRGEPGA
jgi:AGZA family xanthine/uracil permease-like MFS transporter